MRLNFSEMEPWKPSRGLTPPWFNTFDPYLGVPFPPAPPPPTPSAPTPPPTPTPPHGPPPPLPLGRRARASDPTAPNHGQGDVCTVCYGMAASMGAFLMGAGAGRFFLAEAAKRAGRAGSPRRRPEEKNKRKKGTHNQKEQKHGKWEDVEMCQNGVGGKGIGEQSKESSLQTVAGMFGSPVS